MALKNISKKSDTMNCPRCGGEAIMIDGHTIQWLTCTKCKFKKIMDKKDEGIRVVPLNTPEEAKVLTKI